MGQVTHGMTYSKIYRTWIAMLSRCRNQNEPNFKNYGMRGIYVCERWYKFENFFEDMGEMPFYHAQLDRIDNEKGYFKENCRWVTAKQNSRNRRTTKHIKTHQGNIVQSELMEIIGWSKNQFTWFLKKYGLKWILSKFKDGTLPKKKNQNINREDIISKKFGNWIVLNLSYYTKKDGHMYLCRCVCGKEKNIQRSNLIMKKSTSCRSCSTKNKWLIKKTAGINRRQPKKKEVF